MSDPHHGPKGDSPLVQLMVSMSGASAPEHETEPPGADPVSLQAGHEPDRFDVRGILYVPLFVVVIVGLAYVLITSIFAGMVAKDDPKHAKNQLAAELNKPVLNERLGRTSSTHPDAIDGQPDTAVPQPRLEFLKQQTTVGGPSNDTPYLRSKRAEGDNNPPEYRPEDLRPENYEDPATGKKVLVEYGWVNEEKKVARVPIDAAMKAITAPGKLPTKKDKDGKPMQGPAATSDEKAKPSNAGRGVQPATTTTPPAAEHKEKK